MFAKKECFHTMLFRHTKKSMISKREEAIGGIFSLKFYFKQYFPKKEKNKNSLTTYNFFVAFGLKVIKILFSGFDLFFERDSNASIDVYLLQTYLYYT